MSSCFVCDESIEPFIDFGPMPIANGFLTEDQLAAEPRAPLRVGFCAACKMVQLTELVEPEQMFHENYAFFTSSSAWMCRHFASLAETQVGRWLSDREDPFIVEIGSNDGSMLLNFAERGMRHLGIEPSANVAAVARERGVATDIRFFGLDAAKEIVDAHGHADLVLATNVMCHIPDLNGVFGGIAHLLKPDGVLVFEDPYLGDIIQKTSYDQIYDEHA
ncbi:MAG: methyltransferase domain-containing protein, partial [Euryarchaeota archaeon]|nr:methyltransferase domain-containing protein [Euryarchaeota archaeon]